MGDELVRVSPRVAGGVARRSGVPAFSSRYSSLVGMWRVIQSCDWPSGHANDRSLRCAVSGELSGRVGLSQLRVRVLS